MMNDIEILAELERLCFPNSFWTMTDIESTLRRSDVVYRIKYYESIPVGYCIAAAAFEEGEIYRIGVLPEYRRRGIGKEIINELTETLPSDIGRLFLEVRESNLPALSLYQSCGFKALGVRKNYYGANENAVIMERINTCPSKKSI